MKNINKIFEKEQEEASKKEKINLFSIESEAYDQIDELDSNIKHNIFNDTFYKK